MMLVNPAVVGDGWRLLGTHEVLQLGDQTGYASSLMALGETFHPWRDVDANGLGETVAAWVKDDMDARDCVFRRRTSVSDVVG